MSTLRRRLLMAARKIADYFDAWFRTEGFFRSEPW
jgi:hypothetical protein